MRGITSIALCLGILCAGDALALGIDIGPVRIDGPRVTTPGRSTIKVGDSLSQKTVVSTVVNDEDEKDRVRRMTGYRKGDEGATFTIKVFWADLDDRSKDLLRTVKPGRAYQMTLRKLDEDWQLEKIRDTDD